MYHVVTEASIGEFAQKLVDDEKSKATVEKYSASLKKLMIWLNGRELSHELLAEYRNVLCEDHAAASVNGAISAINKYLDVAGLPDYKLKFMKVQRKIFRSSDREMTKDDYCKLIRTAMEQGRERLLLIMETICSTGIRVSEVEYITVESITQGYAEVTLKGKTRIILMPKKLRNKLRKYARKQKIISGRIFLTRNGTPVSRKQIWAEMKSLCEAAKIKGSDLIVTK